MAKLERRRTAIEGDLARVDDVAGLRHRASLLLTNLHAIGRRVSEVELVDHTSDPPATVRIAIDPSKGAKAEAEALFRRARKLERGAQIAIERRTQTENELAALRALGDRLRARPDEMEAIAREAGRLGARPEGKRDRESARVPYRSFRCAGDRVVLVGRTAPDNDALTVRIARPQDLWLHARGVSGSHIVVPLEKDESCPSELLIDAAHLAAHFSDARGEPIVDIQYTPRRYVRKQRGSPGAVTLLREKVLALRFSPERLSKIVAGENHE
jgi:predicted ribosome quality control (RQC) complex YloA/Tae2 family protein